METNAVDTFLLSTNDKAYSLPFIGFFFLDHDFLFLGIGSCVFIELTTVSLYSLSLLVP